MEQLNNRTSTVVIDASAGCPRLVYWGALLPASHELDPLRAAESPAAVHGGIDEQAALSLLPTAGDGFPGRPGLLGARSDGTSWSPRFRLAHVETSTSSARYECVDELAALRVNVEVTLDDSLLLSVSITNTGTSDYLLHSLSPTLPLPGRATEVLDFTGRWSSEFRARRRSWATGALSSTNRRGRTSHDHPPVLFVGEKGFGEWDGAVWGAHLAWSGNHEWFADVLTDGRRYLQMGELLHPGEVVLAPGESYAAPTLVAVHSSTGLTEASWGFHRYLRSLPAAPTTERPVTLNTWEAMYFDHNADRLLALVDAAAECGVERFVLDDGWFSSRRDDTSGLGDWWVSPEAHPNGLEPLISAVRDRGMQFGLWVEPEMLNRDSYLFRSHPEWAAATVGYEAIESRNQLVLDLTNPDAFRHVADALHALLDTYDIGFLKWDMNRDHIQASDSAGRAATHRQTLAVYALMDELRARHPHLEIEGCSSGGGRIDAAVLRRVERVWTSDCNDALERQHIQRGASMFITPEVMGAHIGPERSHTTGRRHDLSFRAATAFFGHLGVECNLLDLAESDRSRLAEAIALHKRFRHLLHHGDVVRFDHPDPSFVVHGVYATDRSEALISIARVSTSAFSHGTNLLFPGLDPDSAYVVRHLPLFDGDRLRGAAQQQPAWTANGVRLTGRLLAQHGLASPALWPEQAMLAHATRDH